MHSSLKTPRTNSPTPSRKNFDFSEAERDKTQFVMKKVESANPLIERKKEEVERVDYELAKAQSDYIEAMRELTSF